MFFFSFLSEAFTAAVLAVINFVTNHNDRCIDMHRESSSCLITPSPAAVSAFYLFGIILGIDPGQN